MKNIATQLRIILLSALVLGACASASRAAENYPLHVIVSLTGTGAFIGQGEKRTLELLQVSVNHHGGIKGRPVSFVFHDDQTNPQVAVQIVTELVTQKVNAILGPSLIAECNAAAPLVNAGPVMYCFSPSSHPPPGSFVFSAGVSTVDLFGTLVRYFRLKGRTQLGLLASTDASGQDADKGFAEVLAWPENKNVKIVEHSHFNLSDVSVAAQIERMRAAKPDLLLAWTTGTAVATIFKAVIQAGYDVPVATSAGNQSNGQMAQFASFVPKELYIPTSTYLAHDGLYTLDPNVEAEQQEMYRTLAAANIVPDQHTAAAWDPAAIVIAALRKVGPDAAPEQIRQAIAALEDYAGIDGMYNFKKVPQRGLDQADAVVTLWQADKSRWIWRSAPGGAPLKE
jgi:branched-chain amino acid transport system substrate-binding protein